MISARDLTCAYGAVEVLRAVDLEARAGEVVGLIGPNGSGKSTLLRAVSATLAPVVGTVRLDGEDVAAVAPAELARRMAVVAQDAPSEVPVTVGELVLLGRSPHRAAFRAWTREDHRLAAQALVRAGVRHLADRRVDQLSGGERQRVHIARALAQATPYLLLDEPTNHLDIRYQHEVLGLVRSLPVTTVVVLHDLNLAARYCDRLVLLDGGRVVASGPTGDVLRPDVLEPVYRVAVHRLEHAGFPQLLFGPEPRPVGRDQEG